MTEFDFEDLRQMEVTRSRNAIKVVEEELEKRKKGGSTEKDCEIVIKNLLEILQRSAEKMEKLFEDLRLRLQLMDEAAATFKALARYRSLTHCIGTIESILEQKKSITLLEGNAIGELLENMKTEEDYWAKQFSKFKDDLKREIHAEEQINLHEVEFLIGDEEIPDLTTSDEAVPPKPH